MFDKAMHHPMARLATGVVATFFMAIAINLFIVPMDLYAGGITGACQVLRTLMIQRLGISPGFDFAGILNLIINIPLFFVAWKNFGRPFVIRTIVCTISSSLFLSLIPIPAVPLIEDTLTSCLVGGLMMGFTSGIVLTSGCSTGGTDIIGLYLSKKKSNFSVGRFSMIFNGALYALCMMLFSIPTGIYSTICIVFSNFMVDRSHQQNVVMQVLIFTKDQRPELPQFIMEKLGRGVTYWEGHGGYTGDDLRVLCVCLSKFEVEELQQAVRQIDPKAFFIVQKANRIGGNFTRNLG